MITNDPLRIEVGDVEMYIDLGAEQILAAERAGEKIAVEIKSFIGASNISEFHTAIGQFFNYRVALEEQEPERVLYLAVPLGIYNAFFQLQFIKTVVERYKLKIMIYDPIQEVIVAWKN
ncbi:XisH family protein [Nostoc parmelioides]|uniref:XisH family protein n=1 Tax=Nostoc parmelioides TaxID=1521621 RepID=UPI0030D03268